MDALVAKIISNLVHLLDRDHLDTQPGTLQKQLYSGRLLHSLFLTHPSVSFLAWQLSKSPSNGHAILCCITTYHAAFKSMGKTSLKLLLEYGQGQRMDKDIRWLASREKLKEMASFYKELPIIHFLPDLEQVEGDRFQIFVDIEDQEVPYRASLGVHSSNQEVVKDSDILVKYDPRYPLQWPVEFLVSGAGETVISLVKI